MSGHSRQRTAKRERHASWMARPESDQAQLGLMATISSAISRLLKSVIRKGECVQNWHLDAKTDSSSTIFLVSWLQSRPKSKDPMRFATEAQIFLTQERI